jgi:hypothetical protein
MMQFLSVRELLKHSLTG